MQTSDSYPIERILSAATYLTAGGVGFVWLIIAALAKKQVRTFLMYHILQSIFLSIAYYLLKVFLGLLMLILLKIPFIGSIFGTLTYFLITPLPIIFNFSVIQALTTSIILYLAITSFMGYYSYLPYVSEIIKGNFRH